MSETMSPADWIDGGMTPPRRLPADTDAALAYLADTLGHVRLHALDTGGDQAPVRVAR